MIYNLPYITFLLGSGQMALSRDWMKFASGLSLMGFSAIMIIAFVYIGAKHVTKPDVN